jgi:hypothetical protein
MVSEHGYNTELGWAMLVEVEARVSEGVVVEMEKTQISNPRFQRGAWMGWVSGHWTQGF